MQILANVKMARKGNVSYQLIHESCTSFAHNFIIVH